MQLREPVAAESTQHKHRMYALINQGASTSSDVEDIPTTSHNQKKEYVKPMVMHNKENGKPLTKRKRKDDEEDEEEGYVYFRTSPQ